MDEPPKFLRKRGVRRQYGNGHSENNTLRNLGHRVVLSEAGSLEAHFSLRDNLYRAACVACRPGVDLEWPTSLGEVNNKDKRDVWRCSQRRRALQGSRTKGYLETRVREPES